MSFLLVYGESELSLPLQFEDRIEDLILGILGRTFSSQEEENAVRRSLANRIVDAITATMDLAPPSDKQIKYAVAIARELRLDLTPEVLESRDAMEGFLERHAPTFRRHRSAR